MIEREILKDIKEYKPKFIGPLTFRQFVCLAIAAAIGFAVFTVLYFPLNLRIEICIFGAGIFTVPALLCGWVEPYDVPFEKFALKFLKTNILTPKTRPYKIQNAFEEFDSEAVVYTRKERKEIKKQQTQNIKEFGEEFMPIK